MGKTQPVLPDLTRDMNFASGALAHATLRCLFETVSKSQLYTQ